MIKIPINNQGNRQRHQMIGFDQIQNQFITDYSRRSFPYTGSDEDFAEAIAYYVLHPLVLKQISPAKYQLLKENIFNNIEYGRLDNSSSDMRAILNDLRGIHYQTMRMRNTSSGELSSFQIPIFVLQGQRFSYSLPQSSFLVSSTVHMQMNQNFVASRSGCRDELTDLNELMMKSLLMPYTYFISKHFEELTYVSWESLRSACESNFENCETAQTQILSRLENNPIWNTFDDDLQSFILDAFKTLYQEASWPINLTRSLDAQ